MVGQKRLSQEPNSLWRIGRGLCHALPQHGARGCGHAHALRRPHGPEQQKDIADAFADHSHAKPDTGWRDLCDARDHARGESVPPDLQPAPNGRWLTGAEEALLRTRLGPHPAVWEVSCDRHHGGDRAFGMRARSTPRYGLVQTSATQSPLPQPQLGLGLQDVRATGQSGGAGRLKVVAVFL